MEGLVIGVIAVPDFPEEGAGADPGIGTKVGLFPDKEESDVKAEKALPVDICECPGEPFQEIKEILILQVDQGTMFREDTP